DRIAYHYNLFRGAQTIIGLAPLAPQNSNATIFEKNLPTQAQARNYDVNLHTFQFEKTFLEGCMSAEVRFGFQSELSPSLNIDDGKTTNGTPFQFATQDTLGNSATRFADMTLIWKALLYKNSWLFLTSGLSLGIPTAPDEHVNYTNAFYNFNS